jgi:hypothetical protein
VYSNLFLTVTYPIISFNKGANSRLFKHQQAYSRSLSLCLFEQKWRVLRDKYSEPGVQRREKLRYFVETRAASTASELLRLLVKIFWTAICMLESDFEHEFVLATEIIGRVLGKIDLGTGIANKGQLLVHKNEFRTRLELYAFRINWPGYPGLQSLLMKGMSFQSTL